MSSTIDVEPELFSAIKSSLRVPLQASEELFNRLGFDPFEHIGDIVCEIAEKWQVESLLKDVVATPEDYAVDDTNRYQKILDGATPASGELREIFERANRYDGPVLVLNDLKCDGEQLWLLTSGESMGQGGIHVTFIGFFASEQEALAAADKHPSFYVL